MKNTRKIVEIEFNKETKRFTIIDNICKGIEIITPELTKKELANEISLLWAKEI